MIGAGTRTGWTLSFPHRRRRLNGIHAPRPLDRRVERGIGANMAPKEQMP